MSEQTMTITGRTAATLTLLAQGYDTARILEQYPGLQARDIREAAQCALDQLVGKGGLDSVLLEQYLQDLRAPQPRWDEGGDAQLTDLFQSGANLQEMTSRLHRRPATVRGRLYDLGLLAPGEMFF